MEARSTERTPGTKLALAMLVGMVLCIPLFSVWLLVYDRQTQADTARNSIAEGWGGPQKFGGPVLVIPYKVTTTETATENNRLVVRTHVTWKELELAPEAAQLETKVVPQVRKRSIYEVVVYEAETSGRSKFAFPSDLARYGVALADMAPDRAELRFGLSDPRGLYGRPPQVRLGAAPLRLQPGNGAASTRGSGFFTWVDARSLGQAPLIVDYVYAFRGIGQLSLVPQAGDTQWRVTSSWASPSFRGGFLPARRTVGAAGFDAVYRVGNLALGHSLLTTDSIRARAQGAVEQEQRTMTGGAAPSGEAMIDLVQPVDLYSQVDRAAKYGFLFIGFTFLAFLMFDVIGGVRVSAVEYLLVGGALVLFFVLLLAFAEVTGFTIAYLVASVAIIGLNTAYSAAVLKSWHRAAMIGGLLTALYGVLYVLLSLEDFSLLIGSLMLFVALATVMYVTRNLNWGGVADPQPAIE